MRRLEDWDPSDAPVGRDRRRFELGAGAACDVLTVRGEAAGPTLLAIAAIHGDEYEGPAALPRFCAELDPTRLRGTVIAIPVVNEAAFHARSRCSPVDGRDLAREFPGQFDGSSTSRVAYALRALLGRVDALVDLHSAGALYQLHPWVGFARLAGDAELEERQRRMAYAFGLDFVWSAPLKQGRTLTASADLGIPAIYVEMTGAGQCRPADVAALRTGLRGVCAELGMLDEPYRSDPPLWLRESTDPAEDHLQLQHRAPSRGLFQPAAELWRAVREGETLGWLTDPAGDRARPIAAERAGRVAMLRVAVPVDEGDFLAVVVPL